MTGSPFSAASSTAASSGALSRPVTSWTNAPGEMPNPPAGTVSSAGTTCDDESLGLLLAREVEPELERLQRGRRAVGGDEDLLHGLAPFVRPIVRCRRPRHPRARRLGLRSSPTGRAFRRPVRARGRTSRPRRAVQPGPLQVGGLAGRDILGLAGPRLQRRRLQRAAVRERELPTAAAPAGSSRRGARSRPRRSGRRRGRRSRAPPPARCGGGTGASPRPPRRRSPAPGSRSRTAPCSASAASPRAATRWSCSSVKTACWMRDVTA